MPPPTGMRIEYRRTQVNLGAAVPRANAALPIGFFAVPRRYRGGMIAGGSIAGLPLLRA